MLPIYLSPTKNHAICIKGSYFCLDMNFNYFNENIKVAICKSSFIFDVFVKKQITFDLFKPKTHLLKTCMFVGIHSFCRC